MEKTLIEKKLFSKEECEKIKSYDKLKVRVVPIYHDEYDGQGSRMLSDTLPWDNSEYDWVYDRIKNWIDTLDLNIDNLGYSMVICHYSKGCYFKPHIDDVMRGYEGEIARKRYFTIGVQLSDKDEYGGGELQFETTHKIFGEKFKDVRTMKQDAGYVWIADKHLHWVNEITSGIRWSIQIFLEQDAMKE